MFTTLLAIAVFPFTAPGLLIGSLGYVIMANELGGERFANVCNAVNALAGTEYVYDAETRACIKAGS